MHTNSIEAFKDLTSSGNKEKSEGRVINFLLQNPTEFYTDRQIKDGLGLADMNSVRPRISSLMNGTNNRPLSFLEEGLNIRCPVTKKNVRTLRIRQEFLVQQLSLL